MKHPVLRLIVFLLCILATFNTWQIARLRMRVAKLTAQVAQLESGRGNEAKKQDDVLDILRRHVEKAGEYAGKADMDRAKGELDKSLRLIQDAGKENESVLKFRRTLEDTRDAIDGLKRKIDVKGG
ncbi:MAG: hypothetical protein ACYC2Y_02110 [Armatimonadota bacterium]